MFRLRKEGDLKKRWCSTMEIKAKTANAAEVNEKKVGAIKTPLGHYYL